MKKPRCLGVMAVLGLLVLAPNVNADRQATASRPNIVFILTDDHRRDQLGCYGNQHLRTPNLDRLAADGVLFENASVTSAICTPSRVSYLLGQYERRHGINFNSGTSLAMAAWANSYPVRLREAGYFTGYVGKNHVPLGARGYATGLMEASFDFWYGGHGHLKFYPKRLHDLFKSAKSDTQIEVLAEGMASFVGGGGVGGKVDFIGGARAFVDRRPNDQPFMLTVAFNLPHDAGAESMERLPSDDELYRTAYRDKLNDLAIPSTYLEKSAITSPKLPADVARVDARQRGYDYVDQEGTLRERLVRQYQTVTGIDRFVGRLLDLLEGAGVAGNTVILFASDHGLLLGEHGLGGKALNYEPCLAIPMIAYDPRLPADRRGRREASLVQSIDIAPTILDFASATIPETVQGSSLAPLLNGEQTEWRDHTYAENLWSTYFGNPRCESVRGRRWKYVRYFKNDRSLYEGFDKKELYHVNPLYTGSYQKWLTSSLTGEQPDYEELFDLQEDPDERVNLAGDPQHAALLAGLRERCLAMTREAKGDLNAPPLTVPLPNGPVAK